MTKLDLSIFKNMSQQEMTYFMSKLPAKDVEELALGLCDAADDIASALLKNKDYIKETKTIPKEVLDTLPKMDSNND